MNRITVSITTFGIDYDHSFAASSIPESLREQLDDAESALECADDYPNASAGYLVAHPSTKLSPRQLVATQADLDFKRLTELVNEPTEGAWAIPFSSSTVITASPRQDFEESTSRQWW